MIRNWDSNDAASIVKYANNKKIWLNLRNAFPHPYKFSDAENFLSKVSRQDPRTFFAIADDKEAIGSIGSMLGKDVKGSRSHLREPRSTTTFSWTFQSFTRHCLSINEKHHIIGMIRMTSCEVYMPVDKPKDPEILKIVIKKKIK